MSDLAGPVQKEIRFSIVMYGGVSLAIYINGVSQEIFKLVRATGRKEYHITGQTDSNEYLISEADLTGSEKVYRKLGEHLRATFVVDILSGTSAGGINAIFLAKALVNNQPFHPLKELWLKEGDIGLLINDKKSLTGLSGFPEELGSSSLLNSQRMYYKLLEALDDMEKPDSTEDIKFPTENYKSPYVGELDLFVTATDLHGLPTPLPVGNQRILENQFRATFRFHYSTIDSAGKDSNDFLRKENPFLAFAARCTSSFPVAFEPMCFSDTERVLACSKFNGRYDYKPERWTRFYKDYADRNFPLQPFGDGGYLDNKPFSYATETLSRRGSDIPVERKMVYIEPAPEIVRLDVESKEVRRPDAIDNTLSAVVFLPRQETIRDDLKVIAERNRNVTQINKILQNLTPVTQQVLGRNKTYWRAGGTEWAKQFLGYSIEYFGPSYAFYHQLRVDNTVKELAEAFRRNLNLEENGETAKRLMEAMEKDWRALYYSAIEDGQRKSENDLLYRLDLSYRLRRLQFIQQTINQLLAGILALRSQPDVANPIQGYFKISKVDLDLSDGEQEEAFRNELQRIKAAFNDAYIVLRDAGRSLRTRGLGTSRIQNLQVPEEYILKVERLGGLINSQAYDGSETGALIEEISLLLFSNNREQPGFLGGKLSESADLCRTALKREDNRKLAAPGKRKFHQAEDAAREIIAHIYKHYEFYDMVTYPVLFGTPAGEAGVVDVIRISPQDAPSIIDEKAGQRKKLLGTKFGNFGAFFDQSWRENDMLWGRLDGAESLINAVLPEESQFKQDLLLQVHEAILVEDFLPKFQETAGTEEEFPSPGIVNGRSALVDKFKEYQIEGVYPREQMWKLAARVAPVLAMMLHSMEGRRKYLRVFAIWITRLGKFFNGILSVIDWLRFPWRARKPAARREKALTQPSLR